MFKLNIYVVKIKTDCTKAYDLLTKGIKLYLFVKDLNKPKCGNFRFYPYKF